jgi:hypothetical protein
VDVMVTGPPVWEASTYFAPFDDLVHRCSSAAPGRVSCCSNRPRSAFCSKRRSYYVVRVGPCRQDHLLTLLRADHWSLALGAGLLGAILLVAVSRGVIVHAPHYDELLHVLSAQGLLRVGEPVIADGAYRRAELFTHMVAWSLQLFGDDLVSARIPSLMAAALLVFVLAFGSRCGGTADRYRGCGADVVQFPATVAAAVFARFYTLHALLVTVMLIALFEGAAPGQPGWRVAHGSRRRSCSCPWLCTCRRPLSLRSARVSSLCSRFW